jgi:arsenate reductase
MGFIATSERELIIYYNEDNPITDETLALAKAQGIAILDIEITKNPLTKTQLIELAEMLKVPIKNLLKDPSKFSTEDLCDEDWLTIISKNQQEMQLPIAIKGKKAIFIKNYTDILKLFL